MGAIASGGTRVLNELVLKNLRISAEQIEAVSQREQRELERRELVFRDDRPPAPVAARICILVDDGLATGSTMRAAVMALQKQNPKQIVVAVPVASSEICAEFEPLVDDVVCLYTPDPFLAVGRWYDDFAQLTDDEVRNYLERAAYEMAH
jgi:putative phosphoribosyl transferase